MRAALPSEEEQNAEFQLGVRFIAVLLVDAANTSIKMHMRNKEFRGESLDG